MVSQSLANPILILEEHARTDPDAGFIKSAKQTITNAAALKTIKQIAYEFRRLGVKSGDMVAIDLPEVLSLLFMEAVLHEAATSSLVTPNFTAPEGFRIDWFITNRADVSAPGGASKIVVDDQFLDLIGQNPYGISARDFGSADDVMWVIFSSGTTGTQKAIPVHVSLSDPARESIIEPWFLRGRLLSFLPAKTPLGLFAFGVTTVAGVAFLAIGDNVPSETIELVKQNEVHVFVMSPAQVAGFVGDLERRGETLPQIEVVFTVGTAMSPELNDRLHAATEGCEILNVYASAEGGVAAVREYESDDPFDAGMVRPSTELQIVDDDGVVLPIGETGRIRYRSGLTASGYLGDAASMPEVWDGDWFYPGDLGSLREDGGLTLAGRATEIINAGGLKIDPVRLDQFATAHAGVLEAASFGYETADGIQQVGIALVTEDGFDVQALVADFETTFGPAAPKLVGRLAEIPRNVMGKPLRLALAANYRES